MKPKNLNKQLRLTEPLAERVERVVENSKFSESDVLRSAIEAGLELLENGQFNPFAKKANPTAYRGMTPVGAM